MTKEAKQQLMLRLKKPAFVVGILGTVNLAAAAFGYQLFTDDQMNALADVISLAASLIGVCIGY